LSAGQKRRLNLARLAVCPRALWLLDEPTATLDDRSARAVSEMIEEHCAGGGMALVATHLDLELLAATELNLDQYLARPQLELVT
jgi:heme exporter protein A